MHCAVLWLLGGKGGQSHWHGPLYKPFIYYIIYSCRKMKKSDSQKDPITWQYASQASSAVHTALISIHLHDTSHQWDHQWGNNVHYSPFTSVKQVVRLILDASEWNGIT